MKPIIDEKELYKVEMWLVQLQSWLKSDALIQPPDVSEVYLQQAKEIQDYLDSRL